MKRFAVFLLCWALAIACGIGALFAWQGNSSFWDYTLCVVNALGCVVWSGMAAASIAAGYEE